MNLHEIRPALPQHIQNFVRRWARAYQFRHPLTFRTATGTIWYVDTNNPALGPQNIPARLIDSWIEIEPDDPSLDPYLYVTIE